MRAPRCSRWPGARARVGARRGGRGSGAGQVLGRGAAVAADRRTVPAAAARRGRHAPLPDRMERGRERRGRARLGLRRLRSSPAPRQRASNRSLPHRRPRTGRSSRSRSTGGAQLRPLTCRSRAAASARLAALPARRRSDATGPAARSGAPPGLPEQPIRTWQIWNEPNFKYFVARPNPAEYGKLVKLSYTAIKGARPRGAADPRRPLRRPKEARRANTRRSSRARPSSRPNSWSRCTRRRRASSASSRGVALHPYSIHYQRTGTGDRRSEEGPERSRRRRQGPLDHRARLELEAAGPRQSNLFAKGPKGQARELKGAFKLLERNQAKWKLKRVFWFSVDDRPGLCNFCDGSGLFTEGFVPKPSWKRLRQVRRRHPVGRRVAGRPSGRRAGA